MGGCFGVSPPTVGFLSRGSPNCFFTAVIVTPFAGSVTGAGASVAGGAGASIGGGASGGEAWGTANSSAAAVPAAANRPSATIKYSLRISLLARKPYPNYSTAAGSGKARGAGGRVHAWP